MAILEFSAQRQMPDCATMASVPLCGRGHDEGCALISGLLFAFAMATGGILLLVYRRRIVSRVELSLIPEARSGPIPKVIWVVLSVYAGLSLAGGSLTAIAIIGGLVTAR